MNQNTLERRIDYHWREVLAVGFLSLFVAILAAYSNPASGYEASLYAATPTSFWVGVGVALGLSLVTATFASVRPGTRLAGVLGGTALTTIVSLPLVRSYYYYGTGDALRHLGWTRNLSEGAVSPFEMFYPGVHGLASVVHAVTAVSLPRSLFLVVVSFVVAFVVFVPLLLRSVAPKTVGVSLAALSGFLLLPINNVSTQIAAHPVSQAILFTPVVLYLLFKFVCSSDHGDRRRSVGVLLALASAVTVLYHPQIALNLLLLFAAAAFVQRLARRYRPTAAVSAHRSLAAHTGFLTLVFAAWTLRYPTFYNTVDALTREFGEYLGGSETAGTVVADRSSSLAAVGSGLLDIFVKLFGVEALYAAFAGGVVVLVLLGKGRDTPDARALVVYSVAGLCAVLPLAAVQLIGDVSKLFFRNVGFAMILVTLLGAVGIGHARRAVTRSRASGLGRTVAAGAMAVLLVASVFTLFPSPFVYQPSSHVTDAQMSGYETAFDHQDPDVTFSGIRAGPWRYSDALYGYDGPDHARYSTVTNEGLADLDGYYDSDRYLIVTELDQQREVTAYQELRYTEDGLASLAHQRDVAKVQSNGEFTLYYVSDEP